MANEEDFMLEAEDDAKTIEFIRNFLPQELQGKFSDDELYYFIDVIAEYYSQDGILDGQEEDKDGYIDIDLEEVANYIVKKAKEEGFGEYSADDLYFVAEGELEYVESLDDND